jgi:hypothetical protein
MLSQFDRFSLEVDGRYATDAELQFIADYIQSFDLRVQTYQKLQELELTIVQQTYTKVRSIEPSLFDRGRQDISKKWKQDTIRALRYTAVAVLVDDPDTFRERFLLWFQTIMRAFGAQRGCHITYRVLQEVIKQHLTDAQASLVHPILELSRHYLGTVPRR